MDYLKRPKFHYRPEKGWINDPNGLVYFGGYYHVFYQHSPNFEYPWQEPMHWGHARTKDFLVWEELPVALYPDKPYDKGGCWSGTAIVKDDTLYLFYASVIKDAESGKWIQTVSMAYSKDGISFTKHENNPVIAHYPEDGGPDFRDPAVTYIDGKYYLVMATGHPETKKARLLLYESCDLVEWEYRNIMAEWDDCKYTECPSFMKAKDGFLLTASVCPNDKPHYFHVMLGDFKDGVFTVKQSASIDRGPDQYAGQAFPDHKGRSILITWAPGWAYQKFAAKDIGCMSLPREIMLKDGKLCAYPIKEVRHLLTDSDPAVVMTDDGFTVERSGRAPIVYRGKIDDIKILRDEYLIEIFVNGGEEVYTALL